MSTDTFSSSARSPAKRSSSAFPSGGSSTLRKARAGLSALATGILLFLLWDVLSAAVEPIEAKLTAGHYGSFAGLRRSSPSASPSA